MSFIYLITNDINDKKYVGKTNLTIEERFKSHLADSTKRIREARPLYRAINKYGAEHFNIKELEECPPEEASEREKYWIEKLSTYHYGYNATRGGDGKQIYNYKEIANKYLELLNEQQTASYFGCNERTVRTACKECKIETLSSSEQAKKLLGCKIAMCDKETFQVLKTFESVKEAGRFLGSEKKAWHITEVVKGKRKSAYGYFWKYLIGGLE